MTPIVRLLSASFVLALVACGGGSSTDTPDMAVATDAAPDMRLPQSELFGPCVADSQCPGEGAVCRKNVNGWPGGYCTVPCEDRTVCDDGIVYNHCLAARDGSGSFCEKKCLNGLDCGRDGYTCADIGAIRPESGRCIGFCTSDEQCGAGSQCDTYTGACIAATAPLSDGDDVGTACTMDDSCRSSDREERPILACLQEVNASNQATGWIDGYCLNGCLLPSGYNTSTFFAGDTLPRGTCSEGDVCWPNGVMTEGDIGVCFKECTQNTDCRSGYACRKSVTTNSGTYTFDNGVCMPINCVGASCPDGFSCQVNNNGTPSNAADDSGTCVRNG